MKTILECITPYRYQLGNIIFELDESSQELIGMSNEELVLEMGKYYDKLKSKTRHDNRIVWTSPDGDDLKMGDHANSRLDRPVEKGGDGEHINVRDIINMFVYAWKDLIDMYDDGYLEVGNGKDSNVISCRCYLKEEGDDLVPVGARPQDKNLWAAFFIKEQPGYKIDVIIKTLFRGYNFKRSASQDRLVITIQGKVKKIYPKY